MYQIWQLVVSRPFFPSLSECPPLRSMVLYRYDTLIIPHVTNIVLHVVSVGLYGYSWGGYSWGSRRIPVHGCVGKVQYTRVAKYPAVRLST